MTRKEKESVNNHLLGYSFQLAARVLLYAPLHREDSTYHGLCLNHWLGQEIAQWVYCDYKVSEHTVNDHMLSLQFSHFYTVKPVLGYWQSSYRRCRKVEIVLYHVHIGHIHLTHSYILRKDPPSQCEHCQCILTVRHILVECNHFAQERKEIFGRRDVFKTN